MIASMLVNTSWDTQPAQISNSERHASTMSRLLYLLSRGSLQFPLQLPCQSLPYHAFSLGRQLLSTPAAIASTASSKPTCVPTEKASQSQENFISDFPVTTPGTLTAPDIATGDYEAGINSTEETVPQSPGVAIFWDLDNTRLSKAQPFEVAQRLRQVIQDKYGPVKAMTAYANKATLDFVPRWAVDEAIAVDRATLLYERENEPAEPYRCGICGQKSKTLKKLQMHVKMMHERERRKKLNHVMSKKKDSKKRQRLQVRHGSYLEKYRATVGGLVPNVNYSIDEELTRAMVDVRRVGDRREAADEALKAHASRLCFPRTQDGALENPFTCLVLVSDDSGFKKLLNKAKRAGIKAVQVGSKCALRRVADEHIAWHSLLDEGWRSSIVEQEGL